MSVLQRPRGAARWLPPLRWLPDYRAADLPRDLLAGALLAILLIPQATAYAQLAGLPARAGIWAAVAAPVAYLFLGSSRFLALGPVALVSVLVGETVGRTAGLSPTDTALVLAAATGLFLIVLGVCRLGFLVHFISQPVLTGFVSAAAVLIAATQLEHLLGIDLDPGQPFHRLVTSAATELPNAVPWTVAVGAVALLVLIAGRPQVRRLLERHGAAAPWPTIAANSLPLLLVLAGAGAAGALSLEERGVDLLDDLDVALPSFTPVPIEGVPWQRLVYAAVALGAVAFVTAMAVASSLARRRRQRVDASQEMIALGGANLLTSLWGGYPVGASVSRSAVVFEAGGRSPLAAVLGAALLLATTAPLEPLLTRVPRAVLAAVVCAAALSMVDLRAFRRLWAYRRAEVASMAATAVGVLVGGLVVGIAVGAAAGLALHLWSSSRPRVVLVGSVEGSDAYRSLERNDASAPPPTVRVLRIDESLFFANVPRLEESVGDAVVGNDGLRYLVLDLRAVNDVDASALDALRGLVDDLEAAGIDLCLAELKKPVKERLDDAGFLDRLGPDRIFLDVAEGLEALDADGEDEEGAG